jgi:hypothetical protein
VAVLGSFAGHATAAPLYDGAMTFPAIQSAADPEEYSWEVDLDEGQELRQVDDENAAVYYVGDSEHLAFTVTAVSAHDAEGATVPTTLAVTQPNLITLTVHHRAGNPAAGGAPFDYPITGGPGWEGGFHSVEIQLPPGEVEPRSEEPPPPPTCSVPHLRGLSLRAARRQLRFGDCALGPVHGRRTRGATILRQYRPAGKSLPAGTPVGIKLG